MRSSDANRYMGSMFPCSMRSGPKISRASAILVFQSSPITSAALVLIMASLPTPPLAWKMSGVSGYFALTVAMTRSEYGRENSANCCGDRWCAQLSNSWITCAPQSIWWQTYTARASERCARYACSVAGSWCMICFVCSKWRSDLPSMEYAAKVHGVPMKPRSVLWPSTSERSADRVSRMKGSDASGSSRVRSALTSAMHRTGLEMSGPLPLMTSKSIPSAGRGVRMSLNMMTPSGLNARHGCSEISTASSTVSLRSRNVGCFLHKSW
mmetsp:Transcript_25313/g.40491  ORF Transcript_25313/g.40491 Transcript_25313/m.40491 type:complete len:268 (+) Transcript_25313:221-1024(+)